MTNWSAWVAEIMTICRNAFVCGLQLGLDS